MTNPDEPSELLLSAADVAWAIQETTNCPRCADWQRLGLSAFCPSHDYEISAAQHRANEAARQP